jgi:glycine/D-amino acid oxidase-like deaminating enzyme
MHHERTSTMKALIIVGAGIAGVSTALAAIIGYDKVYLNDDPSPSLSPASQGPARIIRASYPGNEAYGRLVSEALQRIRSGPLSEFSTSLGDCARVWGTGSERKTLI